MALPVKRFQIILILGGASVIIMVSTSKDTINTEVQVQPKIDSGENSPS